MDPALTWLLEPEDPAVRAKALVDLLGKAPDDPDVQAALKESVARGSVARLLHGLHVPEDPNGMYVPKYGATFHRIVALAEMGAPGDEPRVVKGLDACLDFFAKPDGGFGRSGSHLCVTGNMVRAAVLMGRGDDARVMRGVNWLVDQQKPDGGWHCRPDRFAGGTLDAWEALGAFSAIPPQDRPLRVRESAECGVGFLLQNGLGVGTGYAPWERLHFPRHYYYDVLVGLDLATSLGDATDPRLTPAFDLLESKRDAGGRWPLEANHPDVAPGTDYAPHHPGFPAPATPLRVEAVEAPSRWLTLTALRVLARAGR